jgi:hypothetical protein
MLIRLIGVRFTHLVHGTQQLDLFEDTPEMVNLYLSLDWIRRRYGRDGIIRAIGELKSKSQETSSMQAAENKQPKADFPVLPPNPPPRGTFAPNRSFLHNSYSTKLESLPHRG